MERVRVQWRTGRVGAVLLGAMLAVLQGCGGGGGSGAVDTGSPPAGGSGPSSASAPSTADLLASNWLLQATGEVRTSEVQLDADGNLAIAGTSYRFQPGGASGCTVAPAGGVQPDLNCTAMAAGNVYATCRMATTGSRFQMFLLKREAAQAVPYRELAGSGLRLTVCGTPTSTILRFAADGATASMATPPDFPGAPSMGRNFTTSELDALTSAAGLSKDGQVERWIVYRVTTGGAPAYLLLVMRQSVTPGLEPTLPTHLYLPV